jgi:hypothetical protein
LPVVAQPCNISMCRQHILIQLNCSCRTAVAAGAMHVHTRQYATAMQDTPGGHQPNQSHSNTDHRNNVCTITLTAYTTGCFIYPSSYRNNRTRNNKYRNHHVNDTGLMYTTTVGYVPQTGTTTLDATAHNTRHTQPSPMHFDSGTLRAATHATLFTCQLAVNSQVTQSAQDSPCSQQQ